MPIYVYEREDGSTFEKIQKFSDDPLTTCPETGQKVMRQMTSPAVHFKGSGFYQTDYKPSANGSSASSGSSSSSSDSGSSDTKGSSESGSSSSSTASCDGTGPKGGCKACS